MQFARESFGIYRFHGLCMREYDLIYLTQLGFKNRTQIAREDVGLCPFYGSTVKEMQFVYKVILLNKILRNHLLSKNMQ